MAGRVGEKLERGFPWLACEVDGQFAGYAYYGPWRTREAYRNTVESTIYLDPSFQGRGLGRRLYSALIASARAQRRHAMIGIIALPNEASEALHRSLGFARVGVYREVGWKLERWVDIASWELLL
jgi:L-amino acid N-acyltransferase YncA